MISYQAWFKDLQMKYWAYHQFVRIVKIKYSGIFPKGFHWIQRIRWQNICHYSKRAQTCHLLCKRPGCYHSVSKTHVRERIFKLSPIHALVIYQIPWIRWIHQISDPFRENSIEHYRFACFLPSNKRHTNKWLKHTITDHSTPRP